MGRKRWCRPPTVALVCIQRAGAQTQRKLVSELICQNYSFPTRSRVCVFIRPCDRDRVGHKRWRWPPTTVPVRIPKGWTENTHSLTLVKDGGPRLLPYVLKGLVSTLYSRTSVSFLQGFARDRRHQTAHTTGRTAEDTGRTAHTEGRTADTAGRTADTSQNCLDELVIT